MRWRRCRRTSGHVLGWKRFRISFDSSHAQAASAKQKLKKYVATTADMLYGSAHSSRACMHHRFGPTHSKKNCLMNTGIKRPRRASALALLESLAAAFRHRQVMCTRTKIITRPTSTTSQAHAAQPWRAAFIAHESAAPRSFSCCQQAAGEAAQP